MQNHSEINIMRTFSTYTQILFLIVKPVNLSYLQKKLNTIHKLRHFSRKLSYNFCPLLVRIVAPHKCSKGLSVIMASQMSSCSYLHSNHFGPHPLF